MWDIRIGYEIVMTIRHEKSPVPYKKQGFIYTEENY